MGVFYLAAQKTQAFASLFFFNNPRRNCGTKPLACFNNYRFLSILLSLIHFFLFFLFYLPLFLSSDYYNINTRPECSTRKLDSNYWTGNKSGDWTPNNKSAARFFTTSAIFADFYYLLLHSLLLPPSPQNMMLGRENYFVVTRGRTPAFGLN